MKRKLVLKRFQREYPYKIGTIVEWANQKGKVTGTPGPYSVLVDNKITVPISLITTPQAKEGGKKK